MKVIPFRRYSAPLSEHIHDPVDLFCRLLSGEKLKVFCFLDESDLCQKYWIENPGLRMPVTRLLLAPKVLSTVLKSREFQCSLSILGNTKFTPSLEPLRMSAC